MTKETINGIEYHVYRNVTDKIIIIAKPTYIESSECEVINMTDQPIHVMYKNSIISGQMEGANRYCVSAYNTKDNYLYAHVFIEPFRNDNETYKPETLITIKRSYSVGERSIIS